VSLITETKEVFSVLYLDSDLQLWSNSSAIDKRRASQLFPSHPMHCQGGPHYWQQGRIDLCRGRLPESWCCTRPICSVKNVMAWAALRPVLMATTVFHFLVWSCESTVSSWSQPLEPVISTSSYPCSPLSVDGSLGKSLFWTMSLHCGKGDVADDQSLAAECGADIAPRLVMESGMGNEDSVRSSWPVVRLPHSLVRWKLPRA
jgi:hypothetical protein